MGSVKVKTGFLLGLKRVPIGVIGLVLFVSLLSCTVDSPTAETFPTPLTPTPPPTSTGTVPTATPSPGSKSDWTHFAAADALAEMRNLQAIAIAPGDANGAPWLFGGGIHRVEGQTLEMVAPVLVASVVMDGAGQVWFVARYQGVDWLWTVDQEG